MECRVPLTTERRDRENSHARHSRIQRAQLPVQVGFGVAVLIGLWLTYVGWIAKPDSSPAKGVL